MKPPKTCCRSELVKNALKSSRISRICCAFFSRFITSGMAGEKSQEQKNLESFTNLTKFERNVYRYKMIALGTGVCVC